MYKLPIYLLLSLVSFPGLSLNASDKEISVGYGSRFVDEVGDTKEKNTPDYDLTGLEIVSDGLNTITLTIKMLGPVADKPSEPNSWYSVYMDLDRDGSTGLNDSGSGMDVSFALEGKGRGADMYWDGVASPISNFAKKHQFVVESFSIEGNEITMTVNSDAFSQYPSVIIGVWNKQGTTIMDQMESLQGKPIQLFQGEVDMSILKRSRVGSGRYQKSILPISESIREIIYDIDVKKANVHERWLSTIELRLYDKQGIRRVGFRIAKSTERKDDAVIRIHIDGDSRKPHYLERSYVGQHQLRLIFDEEGLMKFFVDGKEFEMHRKQFSISEAIYFVCSTNADVRIIID